MKKRFLSPNKYQFILKTKEFNAILKHHLITHENIKVEHVRNMYSILEGENNDMYVETKSNIYKLSELAELYLCGRCSRFEKVSFNDSEFIFTMRRA